MSIFWLISCLIDKSWRIAWALKAAVRGLTISLYCGKPLCRRGNECFSLLSFSIVMKIIVTVFMWFSNTRQKRTRSCVIRTGKPCGGHAAASLFIFAISLPFFSSIRAFLNRQSSLRTGAVHLAPFWVRVSYTQVFNSLGYKNLLSWRRTQWIPVLTLEDMVQVNCDILHHKNHSNKVLL